MQSSCQLLNHTLIHCPTRGLHNINSLIYFPFFRHCSGLYKFHHTRKQIHPHPISTLTNNGLVICTGSISIHPETGLSSKYYPKIITPVYVLLYWSSICYSICITQENSHGSSNLIWNLSNHSQFSCIRSLFQFRQCLPTGTKRQYGEQSNRIVLCSVWSILTHSNHDDERPLHHHRHSR